MKHSYSITYKNVELKPISEEHLEFLRKWRNSPENTKFLRQIPYITPEMQMNWYENYLNNKDEMTFAICETQELHSIVGSLSLYNFHNGEAEFGKILVGDRNAHGKKIGFRATMAALKIAFLYLRLDKVVLHVFEDNIPAKKIYADAGFSVVDERVRDEQKELLMEISRVAFVSKIPTIDDAHILLFPQCGDSRGRMCVVEGGVKIPFDIKRVFYSYNTDCDAIRGQHANKKSEFVMICLAGHCKVKIIDVQGEEKVFVLNSPEVGLYIPKMLWKDMFDFSEDCVLLVMSNEHYDAHEYIKKMDDFYSLKQ